MYLCSPTHPSHLAWHTVRFACVPTPEQQQQCISKTASLVHLVTWGADNASMHGHELVCGVLPTGGSHEGYLKWACLAAASRGWRAVVLNMRGCNGLPITSARGYNAINTPDIHVALQSIHRYSMSAGDSLQGSLVVSSAALLSLHVCSCAHSMSHRLAAGSKKALP